MAFHYFIFNKPYKVLSQFTQDVDGQITLSDYVDLPKDVYPVGRLDQDSEGLLLLSNDGKLKNDLLHPKSGHSKTYHAQVEGDITSEAIIQMQQGVEIGFKGIKYMTKPCKVYKLSELPEFPERRKKIRDDRHGPTSWVSVTLTEGKFRQVRKMTSAVGFPTLRLVRVRIGTIHLRDFNAGEVRELSYDFFRTEL